MGGEYVDGRADQVMVGTTRLKFRPVTDPLPSAGGRIDHIGFSFTDLPAKLRELEAAGATVTMGPRIVEDLFTIAFVTDPWGVSIELVEDPQHLGFHHVHLRTPDVQGAMRWYLEHVGGVRTWMRGARDAILYPGNVWLMFVEGEVAAGEGSAIEHIGWRVDDLGEKLEELEAKGVNRVDGADALASVGGGIDAALVTGFGGGPVALVKRPAQVR